jgi:DNA-directed RNA polymerase subunit M/transcription elongation factor TFIIS
MESIEIDFDDDGAQDDPLDDDYKPSRARKKAEEIKKEVENKPKIISTYSRVTPKQAMTTTKLMPVSQLKSPLASNSTIGSKIIPKFVTTTQPNRQQTQRRTATQMTKYIDVLPELHECTYDIDTDISMAKLPDKILLLHSELPLKLALSVEHDDEPYLFRQIISPMESNRYVCLLCKGIDVSYATKEEKDILSHYRTLHELEVVTANAKFSEDIVFICLPKAILQQLTSSSSLIPLNAPCQYCGDDIRLLNIDEMKDHYSSTHNKEVVMIEQEEILKMHLFFYCSKCKHQSQDFDSHHKHMKDEHKFKSYKCKSCVLITQDVTRLKTHFRAKHMINSSNQNMQCYYCHGLLIGLDRLNKHIQQSHMVQTGPTEFSCVACLKPCGRGKDLLVHAQNCSQTVSISGSGSNSNSATTVGNASKLDNHKEDKSQVTLVKREEESDGSEAICFLCGDEFESNTICELHQHHVHMKWVSDLRRYTNASEQIQLQIKELTIDDLTPEQDLRKAKVDTIVGHWCRMCDQMVKVYRLFYLHMANYHKLDKEFQCNVSNCKAQFNSPETFQVFLDFFFFWFFFCHFLF